jgi:hypothetical protein
MRKAVTVLTLGMLFAVSACSGQNLGDVAAIGCQVAGPLSGVYVPPCDSVGRVVANITGPHPAPSEGYPPLMPAPTLLGYGVDAAR